MSRLFRCECCGSNELEEHGNLYKCKNCGSKWSKQTAEDVMSKLSQLFDDTKQELLSNARSNLWDAVHKENLDYLDILTLTQRVQELYPDDFFAKFYQVACSDNLYAINKFLDEIDVDKHHSYIDNILAFMFKIFERENILAINNLIERAYRHDPLKHSQIQTKFEALAEEVESDVFNVNTPRDVFVAYKSEDMARVSELVEFLEDNGVSCFVAMRNLRHGRNAARIYDEQLKKAMDNCKIFLFVSSHKSRTIGDARNKELQYIREQDFANAPSEYRVRRDYGKLPQTYKKPRIEYLIEHYKGLSNETVVKGFFDGYNWCADKEAVYYAVEEILYRPVETEVAVAEAEQPSQSTKYCLKCGAECAQSAKFCSACAGNEFCDTYEDYIRISTERKVRQEYEAKESARLAAEKAKQEAEARKIELEQQRKLDAWRAEQARKEEDAKEEARRKEDLEQKALGERNYPTLANYNKQDFEIEGTVLKKYKGNDGDVKIPKGVISIYIYAFAECDSLESITIPDSVISIESHAFEGCENLTNITIPNSVTSIDDCAFAECYSLTSITIPDSVISIGDYAFGACEGLESITIPNSVTSICYSAFDGCISLKSITVDKRNPVFYSTGNCLIQTETKILHSGCKNSTIPTDGSVTSIGDYAFSYCTNLTSITIPNSVTSIGDYAFSYCTNLTSITIPNSVTSIGESAFDGCTSLESITIPDSVTSIGERAFSGCSSLTSITIPDSVTSIGDEAFNRGSQVKESELNVYYKGSIAEWCSIKRS